MKAMFSSKLFVVTVGLALFSPVLNAQNNIQLFAPIADRASADSTNYGTPYTMGSSSISVTCNGAPSATLSRTSDGTGNLLVDNNIFVTVMQGTSTITPSTNVCPFISGQENPGQSIYTNNCYAGNWRTDAFTSNANLTSSDIWALTDGVSPISLNSYLSTVVQGTPFTLTVSMLDEGGQLASSSIYLTTSCTINGVTGPATVGGNPISSTDNSGTSQSFKFNASSDKVVGFGYDITGALPNLTDNQNGAIPQVKDLPLDKAKFQPVYSPGTSFATSNCLIHDGEVLSDGTTAACKLYTLQCQSPTDGTVKGANCPVSSQVNEVVQDEFDGPPFSLKNIVTPYGIFRQGMGFLMASEPWTGGNCAFDPSSGLAGLACPQNLLTSFTGPGIFSGTGLTTNPNSTFLSIYGVPEDLTLALLQSEWPNHWVNTRTPGVKFYTLAPNFSKGAWTLNGSTLVSLPGAASFVPAPIKSLTYGVSPVNTLPNPANEPIAGDVTLPTSANCSATPFTAKTVPNFTPAAQQLSFSSDGRYLLHYYAQDCAGTQELAFTQDQSGSWMTNFYTSEVNVDTLRPSVVGLAVPAPGSFKKGTTVYATYTCTDDSSGAGVVLCGASIFSTESTYTTSLLKTKLDTGSTGTKSLTIYAVDGAGNLSSASVNYAVIK